MGTYNIYIWDLISVVDQLLKATKISIYIQHQLNVQELQSKWARVEISVHCAKHTGCNELLTLEYTVISGKTRDFYVHLARYVV